jgi:nucleoid DNA-binding protein
MVNSTRTSDLIVTIAQESGISIPRAEAAYKAMVRKVQNSLAQGQTVRLAGIGSLKTEHFDARDGTNPRTGAPIRIPANNNVMFKPGKDLRDVIPQA